MSVRTVVVPLAALLCLTACGSKAATVSAPPAATTTAAPAATSGAPAPAPTTVRSTATTTAAADWPSPADCVSYHPASLTTHYEAGIWTVNDGGIEVIRVHGGPTDDTGQKGLALAQHYQRHCFLGRGQLYQDRGSYIFDYWRDPSGRNPTIPGQQDDCSPYNRTNLTVDDMGGSDGWRVKDHDHVLGLFFTEADARAGKLVLSKYDQICSFGDPTDADQDVITYYL
jgi:hypothetical protein